jgi:hypothetical protein
MAAEGMNWPASAIEQAPRLRRFRHNLTRARERTGEKHACASHRWRAETTPVRL